LRNTGVEDVKKNLTKYMQKNKRFGEENDA
jgi:hypothetical protein